MERQLKCNTLKCRKVLTEKAVVTTCSHIFCLDCSNSFALLGNSSPRVCPACQAALQNPDDLVVTHLNPSEDYKTSVLSGLNPTTIMECAGRGLAFWNYQSAQEIVYQEFLAKTWTDKYCTLSAHMDKIIHDANSEINTLNQKFDGLRIDHEKLQTENVALAAALKEKTRKCHQVQGLYENLRQKNLTSATESAAAASIQRTMLSRGVYQDLGRTGSHRDEGASRSNVPGLVPSVSAMAPPPPPYHLRAQDPIASTPSRPRVRLPLHERNDEGARRNITPPMRGVLQPIPHNTSQRATGHHAIGMQAGMKQSALQRSPGGRLHDVRTVSRMS